MAFNVFAHVDDMGAMAESIRHLLAPDGVFVFEVSYLLDVLDHMLLGTIFHEHLCYHSVQPMDAFLRKHGMELIDIERVPAQGGSIVGVVQHANGPYKVAPSVQAIMRIERERRLDHVQTLRAFSSRLDNLKERVTGLVAQCQTQGKSIAGYGAARSGTTLIAQLGLGEVISYIVDDHPQKVNRFSPGSHIPVVHTQELLARQPDYCFILAWIHAREIIAKNLAYLERGGRFVLCCPELKVFDLQEASNL
jgi:hypothetical protein